MDPWAVWLIVGLALLVAELLTLTFALLWLAVGCLAGAVAAWLAPDGFWLQALVAIAAAGAATVYARPLVRRWRASSAAAAYQDAASGLVGREGVVTADIPDGGAGLVRIGSETWSAYSPEPLGRGERVVVVRRGTTRLEVRKKGGDR